MKKSRIIIPALGMLLLSTAASVSGTVAWFTSMQTGTADITSFAVTKTGGSMTSVVAAGAGTKVANSGAAITLNDNVTLTHGSYNHTNSTAFYPNDTGTVFTGVAKPAASTDYNNWALPGTNNQVFFAVSWSITFTYTFSSNTSPVYLYFDGTAGNAATSKMTDHEQTVAGKSGTTLESYKGFRVAMKATNTVIWAPEQADTASLKYQSTASATANYSANGTYVATGSLISSTGYAANLTDAIGNTPTQRADYLGTFATPASGSTSTVTVECVAWFEGNDANIVNDANLHNVSATLGFYTRASA